MPSIKPLLFCFCLFLLSCKNLEQAKQVKSASIEIIELQEKPQEKMTPRNIQMKPLQEVMGQFDPKSHQDFVVIDSKYSDQEGRLMHQDAYNAFISMWEHAKKDGINLTIKSATRNFDYQKGIWERKWTGARLVDGKKLNETVHDHVSRARKILEYSSMPGTSRHHWGTDIDLNAFENEYFAHGKGKMEYEWLLAHAESYGFCQPYTPKGDNRPHGYNEEKWHWSYLPVANQYLAQAKNSMKDSMISGFHGSETATEIGVVEKYILGINHSCKSE